MEPIQKLVRDQLNLAASHPAVVAGDAPGCIEMRGEEGLDLLQRISTNDLKGMAPGSARETIFLDPKGRIVDLVTVGVQRDRVLLLCS